MPRVKHKCPTCQKPSQEPEGCYLHLPPDVKARVKARKEAAKLAKAAKYAPPPKPPKKKIIIVEPGSEEEEEPVTDDEDIVDPETETLRRFTDAMMLGPGHRPNLMQQTLTDMGDKELFNRMVDSLRYSQAIPKDDPYPHDEDPDDADDVSTSSVETEPIAQPVTVERALPDEIEDDDPSDDE